MGRIAPGAVSRRAFPFQDIAIITQRLGAFALSSKVMLQEQVADDHMSSSLRKRGGRPRLADAREPSGRISRRISDSQKDFRGAAHRAESTRHKSRDTSREVRSRPG